MITSLKIKHQDGSYTSVSSPYKLVAGNAMQVIDKGDNTIAIGTNDDTGTLFQGVYRNIIEGNAPFVKPYYITTLNGVPCKEGNLSLLGGPTTQVNPATNGLTIFDMGLPDVDCADYKQINDYLAVLLNYINSIKEQIIGTPIKTSNKFIFGLLYQYKAMLTLWNYLCTLLCVRFSLNYDADNAYIYLMTGYVNTSTKPLAIDGLRCVLDIVCKDASGAVITGNHHPVLVKHWSIIPPYTSNMDMVPETEDSLISEAPQTRSFKIVTKGTTTQPGGVIHSGEGLSLNLKLTAGYSQLPLNGLATITLTWYGTHIGQPITRVKYVVGRNAS